MRYEARLITPKEWDEIAIQAHTTVFGEERDNSLNRHTYVVGVFVDRVLGGYFTCIEMDSETIYIQYGGVFPNFEKTLHVLPGYKAMLTVLKERYLRAWTRIENTNLSMLKMALHFGFLVVGTYTFKNKLFLELENNFGG